MKPEDVTILLCGGKIDYRELPIGSHRSTGMIPVNGRPVIGWILSDLIRKAITRVVIVTRSDDRALHEFVQRSFAGRMNLSLARLGRPGTIVESLAAGLEQADSAGLVRVVLGDTLITDPFEGEQSFLYTASVDYSRRWCLVETDAEGVITAYADKQGHVSSDLRAVAGYYHLHDGERLKTCVCAAVHAGERELSDVLRRYGERCPIFSRAVHRWYDFGHVDRLADARRRLISSRSFNTLSVDPIVHTVTKTSTRGEKLTDELNWYRLLPAELQVLTPRLLKHEVLADRVSMTQEYYGYGSLAEMFVFGDLPAATWGSIFQRVMDVHRLFCRYSGTLPREAIAEVYVDKTETRIAQLRAMGGEWTRILALESIVCNGRRLANLPELLDRVRQVGDRLAGSAKVRIIHGDYCFSNILYDINHQIVRLVDPRGEFGEKGIFGDPRYDVAKLRHSVCGLYDFMVFDMFSLTHSGENFALDFHNAPDAEIGDMFDGIVKHAGYNLSEIKFIEGILFVSMIPLHADQPQRQKAMYCRGIELLNDVLLGAEEVQKEIR